jgi:predicted PurR-regulated permease PerM
MSEPIVWTSNRSTIGWAREFIMMDTSPYEWTFRRVVWATLVLVFIVLCFWLLFSFSQVVFTLFIAIIVGTVIRPVVTWLYTHGISRMAGTIFVYLMLLVMLTSFILLLFPLIAEQSGKIGALIPGYYQSLRDWMMSSTNQWIGQLSKSLPANLTVPGLAQETGQQVLDTAGQVLGYIKSVAHIIFTATAVILLAFYWTLSGSRTIQSLLLLIPQGQRGKINELILAMETKVGFFIAGQGFLCLVIGVMALVAYMLIGLPNAFVLALVAGVLEAVPMIGPLLGAIPAAIIALSISPSKLIWVIVATIIIQQLENSLLVPRVMRKAVGVNPFVSLLAIFAFSSLFGITGALMAIPLAAIIQILLDRFVFDPASAELEVSPGRDYASRLRYEAQDLVQDLRKQARLKKGGSDQRVKQIDQVMDEIEAITTDLDALLVHVNPGDLP